MLTAIILTMVFAVQVFAGDTAMVRVFIDGKVLESDVDPMIINNRTMVPLRAVSEGLGMDVQWDEVNHHVIITTKASVPVSSTPEPENIDSINIMGQSLASSTQLKELLMENNPAASEELVDLYLTIGSEYGIRGDIAFCQAAKETGWWKYGGLVKAIQNNYCGLGATGSPAAGNEVLNGADPKHVYYVQGMHGAFFDTAAAGTEAHIQHLYAYATNKPLPAGKTLLDPRFNLVRRGLSEAWVDLGGKWAVPGYDRNKYDSLEDAFTKQDTYGHSIISNYYRKALDLPGGQAVNAIPTMEQMQQKLEQLKLENESLRSQLAAAGKI